jgi:hypothetical protein
MLLNICISDRQRSRMSAIEAWAFAYMHNTFNSGV